MKIQLSVLLIAIVSLLPSPAIAGLPNLSGVNSAGDRIIVMIPPTEEDAPSPEIWAQISKSELAMSINVLEEHEGKITSFHKMQPCTFTSRGALACDASGDSPLAGTRYENRPGTDTYVCKVGCREAVPAELSFGAPLIFD
jgi:hypothetical protein